MRQNYLNMKENIDINIQIVSPNNSSLEKMSKAQNELLRLS
jgi:hypothetical protein